MITAIELRPIKSAVRRLSLIGLALIIMSGSLPALAFADGTTPTCPPGSSPVTPTQGVTKPTGADSVTYTYDPCTGLYVNQYYTWSPATKLKTPGNWWVTQTFTCNASNGQWSAMQWVWSPGTKSWYQQSTTVSSPPDGATNLVQCPPTQQITDPGPGSTNGVTSTTTSGTSANDNSNATINNNIGSTAGTGNALVIGNTTGGSATSGNAQAIANVINSIQSSSGLGAGTTTFVANINGDVQGNLLIDPGAIQPASDSTSLNGSTPSGLTLNTTTNQAINNNINLAASTGNATVSQNTKAGDATSGTAQAVANVVNLLNSLVSAQQSFVGVININGNFTGNILVPQNFLDSLLASNAPHETISVPSSNLGLDSSVNNNQTINNNVTSSATTGKATVSENTGAGNATSGNANTNVTLFDLTSDHVIASNTLLVFVNVLGQWVGVIMDAPAGTTAAALGGGVTALDTNVPSAVNVDDSNTQSITNNINVAAMTGDATVSQNTSAGDATTGNADTAVNLLNIVGSDFSLSGWFGILFINVFGNWYGSFGVAPPPVTHIPGSGTSGKTPSPTKTFSFIPHGANTAGSVSSDNDASNFNASLASSVHKVLGGTTNAAKSLPTDPPAAGERDQALLVGGGLLAAGLLMLVGERWQSHRRRAYHI